MKKFRRFLLSGFGIGYAHHAPGTWGTLVACVILWICRSYGVSLEELIISIFIICCLGVWAISYEKKENTYDHSWIVLDEWIGISIAILPLWQNGSFLWWVSAFALFRIFDITKSVLPIAQFDAWRSPWGVMGDDIVAGLYTALIVWGGNLLTF